MPARRAEVRRWDPFGPAVSEFDCSPTFFDQLVVGLASESQFVDIGCTAGEPSRRRGGLLSNSRARRSPARCSRDPWHRDHALIRGGDAAGAAQIQRAALVLVEHSQVVVGVAGHADHVAHRQQCPAAGHRSPGCRGQLLQGGRHDDRHRQSVVHAEFWVAQLAANQSIECVVLALGVAAQILACDILVGFAVTQGRLIIGVAHARRGEASQPCIEVGPQFRGCDQLADAHSVGALAAPA